MRAKPVLAGRVATRLEELLHEKAAAMGIRLRRVEIRPVLVYLAVEAPANLAPHSVVCGLKAHTSSVLRREFKELTTIPSLWTREYLVVAGEEVQADELLAALLAALPPCRPPGRPRCRRP